MKAILGTNKNINTKLSVVRALCRVVYAAPMRRNNRKRPYYTSEYTVTLTSRNAVRLVSAVKLL